LCLFLLQSAHGFLRLQATDGADRRAYWAAYLGCGLGVASKGLPALAFLLYAWTYLLANPWQRTHWRKLVHFPSMVTGGLLAFGWFAVVYFVHGQSALDVFWSDQVKERVTGDRWMPLVQFPLFIALCGLCFLPWLLPVAVRSREVWRKVANAQDGPLPAIRFIVLWILTFSMFAASVSKFSTRYVLPVTPLIAVLVAMALTHVDIKRFRPWLRFGLATAALLLLLLATVAAVVSVQLDASPLDTVLAVTLASIGVLLAGYGFRSSRMTAAVCLTVLVYLAFPLSFLSIRHFALPDQGAQLADRLRSTAAWQNQAVHLVGKPALASKIRVCAGGQAQLSRSEPGEPFPVRGQRVVIVSEDDLSRIDIQGYDLHPGSHGLRDLAVRRLLGAMIRGKLADYLHQRRQRHIIAVRNHGAAPIRLADQVDTQLR
jgi:4-amino-4-deoxy-L-arabinose transferase-like glycosyltransferase